MPEPRDRVTRTRQVLAALFTDRQRAQLLASDAGLDLSRIDLAGAPVVFWRNILDEAERQGRVDALLELAIKQVPARRDLADLRDWRARIIDLPCPYRGLEYFDVQHANFYFGREEMVGKLLAKVQATNLLFVVGPSGSGESSLVRAGLVAALRRDALEGSSQWGIEVFRPGPDPLRSLAAPLTSMLAPTLSPIDRIAETRKLADHMAAGTLPVTDILAGVHGTLPQMSRLLLIIDQFEESFTLCADPKARLAFYDALLTAIQEPWITVVLSLRADFYAECWPKKG
jgi:hypothetical protein